MTAAEARAWLLIVHAAATLYMAGVILMIGRITLHQKTIWMLKCFLKA